MSNYPTNKLSGVIAATGDKRIPPATAAAAGVGRLSQEKGFGSINSKPLTQGGVPPFREDFNGIFNLFSQFLLWYQQGGIMKYSNAIDYEVGNEITYSGSKYRCKQANGPASSVKAPTDTSYWEKLVNTPGAVLYDKAQSLSSAQKQQARDNIGAISSAPSIEAVLYGQNQNLTAAQKLTARTNIGAMNSDTHYGKSLDVDTTNLYLNDQGGSHLTILTIRSLLRNVFMNSVPAVTDILWSGDLDHDDITLSAPFTDYDVLMCVFGSSDNSPPTTPWDYSFIPVWILRKAIIEHDLFGIVPTTIDITNDHFNRWTISIADSTTTFFKHHYDNGLHMWRIIGIRLTSTAV